MFTVFAHQVLCVLTSLMSFSFRVWIPPDADTLGMKGFLCRHIYHESIFDSMVACTFTLVCVRACGCLVCLCVQPKKAILPTSGPFCLSVILCTSSFHLIFICERRHRIGLLSYLWMFQMGLRDYIVLPLISVKISVGLLIGPETDQSASGLSLAARHIEIQSGRLKEGETLRPQSLKSTV